MQSLTATKAAAAMKPVTFGYVKTLVIRTDGNQNESVRTHAEVIRDERNKHVHKILQTD